jgi:hypothetical protein
MSMHLWVVGYFAEKIVCLNWEVFLSCLVGMSMHLWVVGYVRRKKDGRLSDHGWLECHALAVFGVAHGVKKKKRNAGP